MTTQISGDTGVSQCQPSSVSSDDLQAGAVTPDKLSQKLTLGTAQATTSGTSIDFTGIPSWVKRITISISGVSTNGTSNIQVQLGTAGGIETSSYLGAAFSQTATNTAYTSGALLTGANAAATIIHGSATFTLLNSSINLWSIAGVIAQSNAAAVGFTAGSKSLSGVLDKLRLTTVNGTDVFDVGSVNILYEG